MKTGLLAAAMFIALLATAVVVIELVRVPNMYAIEGRGEIKYTPRQAEITASIYAENVVSLDAVKEAASTMRAILAGLKNAGVAAGDIKTADVRSGLLDTSDNRNRAEGEKAYYYAEQIVIVQVSDISHIGKVLDAIARAGSNYWLVRYKPSDPEKLMAAARKAAFLNAVETADIYARDGKFKRGRVLKIQDDAMTFPEIDYPNREYRMHRDSRGGVSRSPVERVTVTGTRITEIDTTFDIPPPREQKLEATTQVLFEIN